MTHRHAALFTWGSFVPMTGFRTGPAPPRDRRPAGMTAGVEEEFLLVDAERLRIAAAAEKVLAVAASGDSTVHDEGTRYQVESATPVARTMDELTGHLTALRLRLADAAAAHGCRLVAGPPVLPMEGPPLLRDTPRRHAQAAMYGALTATMISCGCHVHIGVSDPDTAVKVAAHLRPWLPTLLALSANSPFWDGRDTGHASWRTLTWASWPTAGMPPVFTGAADYSRAVDTLLRTGAALDRRMVYWDIRPSASWPTLEVRVADVSSTVEEAVLQAALVRALVATALGAVREGRPPPPVRDDVLTLARWRAARDGLEGDAVDPWSGTPRPAVDLAESLVEHVRPALEATDDHARVANTLDRLRRHGSGAARQRRAYERRQRLADVVRLLADETECL